MLLFLLSIPIVSIVFGHEYVTYTPCDSIIVSLYFYLNYLFEIVTYSQKRGPQPSDHHHHLIA
jgi:hypothetical protein